MINPKSYSKVLGFAVLLTLIVIVLGAYTRLTDSGLGCPDWPGCYGQLSVPENISTHEYQRPLEKHKAWNEMIHRYVAGTLGFVVLFILFMTIRGKNVLKQSVGLPLLLLATVIFQALLGMWTVTLLLSPLIVTAHLLGGFTTLSLLWWLWLNNRSTTLHSNNSDSSPVIHKSSLLKIAALFGLLLVIIQIFLGGWTSTNYAALACGTQFPSCFNSWWPDMDFVKGFELTHESGVDYEFGVLESPARTAIHYTHRMGALVVFSYMMLLGIRLLSVGGTFSKLAKLLLVVLFSQVSLGIMNVMLGLPIAVATLHTLFAALLLLATLAITHRIIKS
ncbi:COX15/CtaA family protein [Cocleimonas flava]|uniref:Cytochrome c oxidase assembly protein subunit 15 n=1 Tax=Cocleimonas flava TaxID=634765 RepID=A0A4R1EZ28_9GAMM|nr:COX15/CtaA family protein [Cocleimonas flava]TCJ84488.1 cytochrome c oxidase assembly protein subunit 15 [Cocleimonas flava]